MTDPGADLGGAVNPPGAPLAGALKDLAPKPSVVFPIAGQYTWGSEYGPRNGGFHSGQDLPASTGTPLVAVVAGRVTFQNGGAGGNAANLDADDGTRYYYAHLSTQRLEIANQRVEPGTVLGAVGSTGNSTGPHLHFSIFQNGQAIDPRPWLRAAEGKTINVGEAGAGPTATPAGISNPLDAVRNALDAQAKIARLLTDPAVWMRILHIAAGAGLILGGVAIIKRDAIVSTATTATRKAVLGAVTGGAGAVVG